MGPIEPIDEPEKRLLTGGTMLVRTMFASVAHDGHLVRRRRYGQECLMMEKSPWSHTSSFAYGEVTLSRTRCK